MAKGAVAQLRALREAKALAREQGAVKPILHEGKEYYSAKIDIRQAVINTVNNTAAKRQRKWRDANPDLNRKRAREGMRKKRAASNVSA